jgi:metalloendopeptidase OMA1, mitochondrial
MHRRVLFNTAPSPSFFFASCASSQLVATASTMNAFRLGLKSLRRSVLPSSRIAARVRSFQPVRQNRHASYQRFPGPDGRQYSRSGPAEKLLFLWANYRPVIVGTGTVGGVFYVYNLEEVPITGRRRFNCLSPETEKQVLGDAGYEDLLREYRGKILPENHPNTQMVKRVVERLLPAVGDLGTETEWAVHVIDEPNEKNAFVVPGGKVFVFSGILPICQDENGIATVLGHEIAHNIAHHTAERISRSFFVFVVALAATALFDVSGTTSKYITDLVLSLPNGRTQEAEADHIGLLLMARSCFDPNAAIDFWRRMGQAQQFAPPQFLSTHPSHHNREEAIRDWLPQATTIYESSECGSTSAFVREFKRAFEGPQVPVGRPPQNQGKRNDDDDLW